MRPLSLLPRRWCRAAAALMSAGALGACQTDRPTSAQDAGISSRPSGSAVPVPLSSCPTCIFGNENFVRGTGKPDIMQRTIAAVPASWYALDVIGSRGADVAVSLNGETLVSGERPDSVRVPVSLLASNALSIRHAGRPLSLVRVAVRALVPFGLDQLQVTSPTAISPLVTTHFTFAGRVTNYTATTYANMVLRSEVQQGTTRIATGSQPVTCSPPHVSGPGIVPPGRCTVASTVAMLRPALPNAAELAPGPATLSVQLAQIAPFDTTVYGNYVIPIVLEPLQVVDLTVVPTHVEFPRPGLTADLRGTLITRPPVPFGFMSGAVTISSSNPAISLGSLAQPAMPTSEYPFTFTSRLVAIAEGAALIRATPLLDPMRQVTTLVSVGVKPSLGVGISVSPGIVSVPEGGAFTPVVQLSAAPYGPLIWSASSPEVASVDLAGRISAHAVGSSTISVRAGGPADPRVGLVQVSVYRLAMLVPQFPIRLAANPDSPSGLPTSFGIAAWTPDPAGVLDPEPVRVTFYSTHSPAPLSPVQTVPRITPQAPGPGRYFVWTHLWTPGPAYCCGTYKVFARTSGVFGITSTPDSMTVEIVP
jgi:hypothetical protein